MRRVGPEPRLPGAAACGLRSSKRTTTRWSGSASRRTWREMNRHEQFRVELGGRGILEDPLGHPVTQGFEDRPELLPHGGEPVTGPVGDGLDYPYLGEAAEPLLSTEREIPGRPRWNSPKRSGPNWSSRTIMIVQRSPNRSAALDTGQYWP